MSNNQSPDFTQYNKLTKEPWDRLAHWWDHQIGDGNSFQKYLIEPITERMLELSPGDCVLDIACGSGRFARRMSYLTTNVVAIDQSEKFIELARKHSIGKECNVEYHTIDASASMSLISLGRARFDAIVCTMALMDMASINPLISTIPKLLKPGGRFVFSVTHPVFNSGSARKICEEFYKDGALSIKLGVTVTDYSQASASLGIGIQGQPEPHYFFHRPIDMLLNTCFKHGLMLDWIEEPTFDKDIESNIESSLAWANYHSIPPVLIARLRTPLMYSHTN